MRRISILSTVVAVLLAAGAVRAEQAAEPRLDAAVLGAGSWLELVDGGKYAESWREAGRHFKGNVTEEKWVAALGGVREPLGGTRERQVVRRELAESLPGAPDGEYAVLQYQTSFANKEEAVETVTLSLEEDGAWRVVGYFIR